MLEDVIILIAEDDLGHADLIKRNLKRSGISNEIIHFSDGQEIITFLFENEKGPKKQKDVGYLILLDIRMPKVDGIEVLCRVKEDELLKSIPVIMLTTTDNPNEVKRCHKLGCNSYITKPIEYKAFIDAIHNLGLFLRITKIPAIS